jgi:biotin synthase
MTSGGLKDAKSCSEWLNAAGKPELSALIRYYSGVATATERLRLAGWADEWRQKYYDNRVFLRGLIEFSSYCKNDCYYCGLQKSNHKAKRYRLTENEILECCEQGYRLGLRTFVLQSGEDRYFTDARLVRLILAIKARFPDCAVTLSLGERSYDSYQQLFTAGTDRYLLRHETANEAHYGKLHPPELSLANRKQCLYNLRRLGYQVGAGFMVDSPFQTFDTLAEDLIFLRELQPQMIGIGPFIPHVATRFAGYNTPNLTRTLIMLSLLRIMLPKALIPATTALGTVDVAGRAQGLLAGANVVMPNLSPVQNRTAYAIYDHKLCTGEEAAEGLPDLARQLEKLGLKPDYSRGDYVGFQRRAITDAI